MLSQPMCSASVMAVTEESDNGRDPGSHTQWSRQRQNAAAIMWPSFMIAGLATIVFFAFFDPVDLGDVATPSIQLSRMTGYALGFFMFWVFLLLSSALTLFLVTTAHEPSQDKRDEAQ